MKRLALLTIPFLAASIFAGGITASAAEGGIIYPADEDFTRTLTLSSLTDYAIEDDLFVFADGGVVKVYDNGNYDEYEFNSPVTAVEIEEGKVYYGLGGKAYRLSDRTECEHQFTADPADITTESGFYYYLVESGLKVYNKSAETTTSFDGYFKLNEYNKTVYAVHENKLYEFTGSECSEVVLEYVVKSIEIPIGDSRTALKQYSAVQFVEIAKDSLITEVDLEQLDEGYFKPEKGSKNMNIVKVRENTTALLLCESGNAAIVSIQDKAYAVLQSKISETNINPSTESPYDTAQIIGGNIYASPFVSSGTVATSDTTGLVVKVLGKIEYATILGHVFYEVEYTVGEESVKGYVAEGLLSSVMIKDDNPPKELDDPHYTEKNDTKTILIILAVVLLVLAAVVYIGHLSSKRKKKGENKKEEKEE